MTPTAASCESVRSSTKRVKRRKKIPDITTRFHFPSLQPIAASHAKTNPNDTRYVYSVPSKYTDLSTTPPFENTLATIETTKSVPQLPTLVVFAPTELALVLLHRELTPRDTLVVDLEEDITEGDAAKCTGTCRASTLIILNTQVEDEVLASRLRPLLVGFFNQPALQSACDPGSDLPLGCSPVACVRAPEIVFCFNAPVCNPRTVGRGWLRTVIAVMRGCVQGDWVTMHLT